MNNLFHAFSTSFHFKTVYEHIIYCQITSRAASWKLLHAKHISQMCTALGIIFCPALKTISSKFSQKQSWIISLMFPSLLNVHTSQLTDKANRAGRSSHNKILLSKCCLHTSLVSLETTPFPAWPIQSGLTWQTKPSHLCSWASAAGGILGQLENIQAVLLKCCPTWTSIAQIYL